MSNALSQSRPNNIIGYILATLLILTPLAIYLYTIYLSIVLFLIPAFTTYFALYGVWATFGMFAALGIVSFISSYAFFAIISRRS